MAGTSCARDLEKMGKPGKSGKAVDWVTLMDELWTSDEENSPNSKDEGEMSTPLTVSQTSCRPEEEQKNLQSDKPSTSDDGAVPCLCEDPLSRENDSCHSTSTIYTSTSSHCSPVQSNNNNETNQSTCPARTIKQTDLLSYIDRKYSRSSMPPLTDIQNVTSSESTDDGYSTLDTSRLECTPQLFLPNVPEDKTKLPRTLFSHKTTKRRTRKRKASEVARTSKRSKVQGKENEEQLYLDLGQRNFGHVTCKVCGMVYTSGQPADQAEHLHFHKNYLSGINFPGWKKEHVVDVCSDGRIISVLPRDPKHHLRKVEEIIKIVDFELGYASGASMSGRDYKVFLYISLRKRVMGCVIAEAITEGYRVLSDSEDRGGTPGDSGYASWLCSTSPQPAELGINRLWVSASCRRKGVASKLVDAARSNFVTGCVVPKSKVAFSDPTPDGRAFASRYTTIPNFLVYRWL